MELSTVPMATPTEEPGSSVGRVQACWTRPRCCGMSPCRTKVPTCSSMWSSLSATCLAAAWSRPLGSSPRSAPGTRVPVSAATSSPYPTVSRFYGPGSRPVTTTRVEPSAASGCASARPCAEPPATNAPRHCTSTRWTARFRLLAATARPSSSTWISWTAPAVLTFLSPASPGVMTEDVVRAVPAARHVPRRTGDAHNAKAPSSRRRARQQTCCSSTSPTGV